MKIIKNKVTLNGISFNDQPDYMEVIFSFAFFKSKRVNKNMDLNKISISMENYLQKILYKK